MLEAREAAGDHVAEMVDLMDQLRAVALEVSGAGEGYHDGVKGVARTIVDDIDSRKQILGSIAAQKAVR